MSITGDDIKDFILGGFTDASGQFSLPKTAQTVGGLAALYGTANPDSKVGEFLGMGSGQQGPIGYTGGIPKYTATRSLLDNAFDNTDRRPGSKGRSYFTDTVFTKSPTPAATDAPADEPPPKKPISPTDLSADPDLLAAFAAADAAGVDIPETVQASTQAGLNQIFGTLSTGAGSSPATEDYTEGLAVFEDEAKNTAFTPTTLDLSNLGPAIGPEEPLDMFGVRASDATDALANILRDIPGGVVDFDADTAVDREAQRIGVSEAELVASLLQRGQVTAEDVSTAYGIPVDEIVEAFTALGGTRELAMGGIASLGGPNYLAGATDGMADLVPATIGGTQPAALSDGEFVIPADVVSHLGNGNSDAGAKQLYAMMDRVRDARTGTTKQGPELNPTKMLPA